MITFLTWFSALSFLGYGISCVFTGQMVAEFKRYRLENFRLLTGVLQILGAVGLLIGFLVPIIGFLAAAGLALQMLLGFGVRIKIRDPLLLTAPSFIFMLMNGYLCHSFYQNLF